MPNYICGSCGQGTQHIEGRCRTCGGPFSPPKHRPVMAVEVTLPDGTIARWSLLETDDRTIDRLTDAIESIIGPADTIIT